MKMKPTLFALVTIIIAQAIDVQAQSLAPYILSGYICEVLYTGGSIKDAIEVGMPQAIIDPNAPKSQFTRGMNDTIRNVKVLCPELFPSNPSPNRD